MHLDVLLLAIRATLIIGTLQTTVTCMICNRPISCTPPLQASYPPALYAPDTDLKKKWKQHFLPNSLVCTCSSSFHHYCD